MMLNSMAVRAQSEPSTRSFLTGRGSRHCRLSSDLLGISRLVRAPPTSSHEMLRRVSRCGSNAKSGVQLPARPDNEEYVLRHAQSAHDHGAAPERQIAPQADEKHRERLAN